MLLDPSGLVRVASGSNATCRADIMWRNQASSDIGCKFILPGWDTNLIALYDPLQKPGLTADGTGAFHRTIRPDFVFEPNFAAIE